MDRRWNFIIPPPTNIQKKKEEDGKVKDNGSENSIPKRTREEQRRRDTMQAYGVIFGVLIAIMAVTLYMVFMKKDVRTAETVQNTSAADSIAEADDSTDSQIGGAGSDEKSDSSESENESVSEPDDESMPEYDGKEPPRMNKDKHKLEVIDGRTYIDGLLIVNKTYSLPSNYAPGILPEAQEAFDKMANDSWGDGIGLYICSGFRSYDEQKSLYDGYASERGVEEADRVSSRAGHSEHQSGLGMDVNTTDFSFEGTPEAKWLEKHCAEYGFIIRFPKGKESVTGYAYEPWHIRYVGEQAAKEIMEKGICLEEYLGVTSDYRYSNDQPMA